jgi:hypothetical protein
METVLRQLLEKEYKYGNFTLKFRLFGEELVLEINGVNGNSVSVYFRDISKLLHICTFDKRKLLIDNHQDSNMSIVTIGGI